MSNYIQVDLQNYVRSIKLKDNQYLFPLYEVVVNSIQAIQEADVPAGKIDIIIKRDTSQQLGWNSSYDKLPEITDFEVIDNGIGFNDVNRNSFSVAFTGHKAALGCKGVGRFLALAAFKDIQVDSTYYDENKKNYLRRTFYFDAINRIHNESINSSTENWLKTSVKLNGYKAQFRKNTHPDTIANNLLHHCLIYFITRSQPDITIHDDCSDAPISLNNLFEKYFEIEDTEESLDIGRETFEMNFVKNYSTSGSHKIHYCGDKREVKTESLSKFIPVLEKKITDNEGGYYISVYVKGEYLNRNLTPLRDEFVIPKNIHEKDIINNISLDELSNKVASKVKNQFTQEIRIATLNHRENYRSFIFENGLEYRHLLQDEEKLDTLKSSSNERDKEMELHRLNYELEVAQRDKVSEFLNTKNIKDSNDYKELLEEVLEGENKLGQSKLVNYMLHRKTVLKVLEKFISIQPDGNFKLEADIHDIIFHRDKTSSQISFNEHNLWLLDERVAFSKYIASDKNLKEIDFLEVDSEKKPDVLIYDNTFVYGEDNTSIVIFEFKRPMRDYYRPEERNLGNQVKTYVKELMSGRAKDYRRRITNITKDTPKFGYIICDYNLEIKTELELEGYKPTPKGTLFKYEDGLNLFIEVLNYEQLLKDANMRHRAFFSAIGIHGL